MAWMEAHASRREHPNALWEGAGSVVMFGLNYGPDRDPRDILKQKMRGAISVYAQGDDYHELIKGKLKRLGQWLAHKTGQDLKVFVDTAPLMEKPLGQKSGLGWQGKHTNLVSREFGSWLFLGVMLTECELVPDAPERDHCGTCRSCIDICPTGAITAPYQIDARACISYLTIELKGPVPHRFRKAMGNRIYGCDDCLAICPWNKFAQTSRQTAFHTRPELAGPLLAELAGLDDAAFREVFSGSPVRRIGRDRFVRNVLIAVGNSCSPDLAACAADRLADPSPLVRGAAVWALGQLDRAAFLAERARRLGAEPEAYVRSEWNEDEHV